MRIIIWLCIIVFSFVGGISYKVSMSETPSVQHELTWEYEVEEQETVVEQDTHIVYTITNVIEKSFHIFTEKLVQLLYNFAALFFA